ncbi:hypothetical protein [Roseofilum casamattae]|uniref:Uncharacterized protein n=1 Tax=Roseofilum casamattae BLCC-M143 TaxID=3022442 RepID=A0ABT7BY60_9CYAN|nr:hypothetical protein [Roseofilum casamattae]MDJ1183454.1 hypothetical protein [Roseofilum casamattae BLCC-M143]
MNANSQITSIKEFQENHQPEIEAITQMLVQIANCTSEQIKPLLDELISQLVKPQEPHFYETATDEEWLTEFQQWADSHRTLDSPMLSDEAISRESIYGERG